MHCLNPLLKSGALKQNGEGLSPFPTSVLPARGEPPQAVALRRESALGLLGDHAEGGGIVDGDVSQGLAVHGDVRLEQPRDGAAVLGRRRRHREGLGVGPRHAAAGVEMDAGHRPVVADLLEGQRGHRLQLVGREAGGSQLDGKGHGETAGVGRRDQLFGVGAGAVLEPRGERIGGL